MFKSFFVILCYIVIAITNGQILVCKAEEKNVDEPTHNIPEKIVPNHEIKYEEKHSPDWKLNWDMARSLYRDKKYPEALVQYEILFSMKENIVEARWEYVSILIYLERWENARAELEKLLAAEPESIRYRLAMAKVSIKTGNIEYGEKLYSQLLELPLSDEDRKKILKGLILAYEMEGRSESIPSLLNQLIALEPNDTNLQLKLASHALELGNIAQAKELGIKLEQSLPQNVEVLSLQARIENDLKNEEDAATYWQKIVAIDPDDIDAHSNLYTYYYNNQNWSMSFKHLEQLLRINPNDVNLLKRAADINMRLERIDRALEYYEFALAVDPLNKAIKEEKTKAQRVLAQELLILVENDTEKKLWQDLVKVAPDSVGVYHEIANLLREKGKLVELTSVLRLLNKENPQDQQIHDELASLLKQQGLINELAALNASRNDLKKAEKKDKL